MNNEQHQEDTKYVQWEDGMYVMLDDLLCDYELALVYFTNIIDFKRYRGEDCLGVDEGLAGLWWEGEMQTKLTRAQALYIATGDTNGK
jgi:hypothetical protein